MFTPVETSIGALLLHQATSVLLYQNGKVLGASGYLRRLLTAPTKDILTFFAGMALSAPVLKLVLPKLVTQYPPVPTTSQAALVTVVVGAIVGLGTKFANGCTSGHMLCGLSRLSSRSASAVALFFPAAIVTHHIVHPTLITEACNSAVPCYTPTYPDAATLLPLILLTVVTVSAAKIIPRLALKLTESDDKKEAMPVAQQVSQCFAGLEFGLGLHISQMASPSKTLSFLSLPHWAAWDPSLAMVMVFGVLPNLLEYRTRGPRPLFNSKYELPTKTLKDTDWRFVTGSILFGIGWGLTGTCPGPAILRALAQPQWGFLWMGGFWLGSQVP
ncbi:YeeE/YedE family integral membrane protein [Aaosphaeria arxii CBS 175.79]|uniref:YeeE/YedE family integral membrane protein n=1 Tax=Aaosphaeria arxii CBS 175.79 TaxID=1450172 RepID=A0A6A5XWA6_9PLEO|nr:YeeE/YedE family integral membrane protein [Aaosphaeria arxii CBS 175.79]KAF2017259.1 YeeE/YedE family integral membrane protein [Aaosphaeria arxii CBS 175.79]